MTNSELTSELKDILEHLQSLEDEEIQMGDSYCPHCEKDIEGEEVEALDYYHHVEPITINLTELIEKFAGKNIHLC